VALTVAELLSEIRECVGGVSFSHNQTNREIRDRLLPPLLELKKKTYHKKPGFYDCLARIGLSGQTVRQWFRRSHAAGEVASADESEPKPVCPSPALSDEARNDFLARVMELAGAHERIQEKLTDPQEKLAYLDDWNDFLARVLKAVGAHGGNSPNLVLAVATHALDSAKIALEAARFLQKAENAIKALEPSRKRVEEHMSKLTRTEKKVYPLLTRGNADKEIGAKLGFTKRTASMHVANIKAKLGIADRADFILTSPLL
jgi:DNA-binding NarL/FixJ family response regulator